MRGFPKFDTLVGWAFAGLGYFLITQHHTAIDNLLHARAYSLALFPHHLAAQYFFMGFFILALLPAAGLCVVTGWGVAHQSTWSRRTGLMPCLYLLLGFPYLTVVGALGLFFLWKQKTVARAPLTGAEFWNSRRQSGWMLTASILGWFVARMAFTGLQVQALSMGLPVLDPSGPGILAFLLIMWTHVGLHECGHALAAKAVGFRVKVLAIGPVVLSKESGKRRVRLSWMGLLLMGGYMGAIPPSPRGFRRKQMTVVGAGPLTSLGAGVTLLGIFYVLPDTAVAGWWQVVGMGAVAGIYLGLINLLPLGYSDGTMLFHLLLRTKRGDELTTLVLRGASLTGPQPPAQDYEEQAAVRRQALQQFLDSGDPDQAKLAEHYIRLGCLQIPLDQMREAEQHVMQGLALIPEGAAPRLEAAAWECLQIVRLGRYDYTGAFDAYRKALIRMRHVRETSADPVQQRNARLAIAGLHLHARAWADLLEETTGALAVWPEDELEFQKGMLLSWRGRALLQTGCRNAGLEAVEAAAAIFRAQPAGVSAPHFLGLLGDTLWNAGLTENAIALMTECIMLLEAREAVRLAGSFRLLLAEILRNDGRVARAACVLPRRERVHADTLALYHERRGSIRRSGGKLPEAIADLSARLAILEKTPEDEQALADARTQLAEALVETGELGRAENLATLAHDTLQPTGNPEFARCCVARAVIHFRKEGTPGDYIDTALRYWEGASFQLPAEKARAAAEAAGWLDQSGLTGPAADCREAADRYSAQLPALPQPELAATSAGR